MKQSRDACFPLMSLPYSFDRRQFLKGCGTTALGVSLGGLGAAYSPAFAGELKKQKKSVLLIWLAGGASQLETWDPKPGTDTGRPFCRFRHQCREPTLASCCLTPRSRCTT